MLLLILYLAGVFFITIGIREPNYENQINLLPFSSLIKMFVQVLSSAYRWLGLYFFRELFFMADGLRNAFGNIFLMVPLGFLLPLLLKKRINKWWKAVCCSVGLSLVIEIIQLISHRGYFDIDDIILNSVGCVIGWACYKMLFPENSK